LLEPEDHGSIVGRLDPGQQRSPWKPSSSMELEENLLEGELDVGGGE